METTRTKSRDIKSQSTSFMPDFTQGLYHSNTVNKEPYAVYEFVKNESNIKNVLTDLPEGIKNFLEVEFVSADSTSSNQYNVKFKNAEKAKIKGDLTFEISAGPAGKGSVLTALAKFGDYSSKDEGPSDLINLFLKRVKAMIETGVLAKTTGQPNGEDKIDNLELKH